MVRCLGHGGPSAGLALLVRQKANAISQAGSSSQGARRRYAGRTMTVLEHAPSPDSLFERIEPLLARVSKPVQYVGGELNSVVKEWSSTDVRWCLSYPDAYEIGLPNQGIAILYEVLNERDWILAERTYAVWGDMEALMREHGVPQFTLDGHRAGRGVRRLRPELRHRARLHEHAHRARPGRHPAARGGPPRARPDRAGRRARGLQPRARSPTSSTPRCSATARRSRSPSPR